LHAIDVPHAGHPERPRHPPPAPTAAPPPPSPTAAGPQVVARRSTAGASLLRERERGRGRSTSTGTRIAKH
ncbi:MAG: hypothetical protein LBT53_07560, partial [Puniceicoccales bacterium]|nr:hypothetical protein [Puniceicoccales bacterium]